MAADSFGSGAAHTAGLPEHRRAPQPDLRPPGWAIRWQRALSEAEIAQSSELLRRMRIDNPLRKLLATAYAPSDLWTVRLYSQAKGWSPALTVSQIYDKTRKQPQLALDLTTQHDAAGRLLAALALDAAEMAVGLVLRHCPQARAMRAEPLLLQADASVTAAIEATWQMVAELRGQPCTLSVSAPAPDALLSAPSDDPYLQLWQRVLAQLQTRLAPAEFATWLAPSLLLSLEQHPHAAHAIVGVPHIFAREQLLASYLTPLTQALTQLLGKPVTMQVEIDATIDTLAIDTLPPGPSTTQRAAPRPASRQAEMFG